MNIKITIFTTLLIILSFLGIKKYLQYKITKDQKNVEKIHLKESIRVLNECFDLENKNKRSLNKSVELINYCLKEYGYKN